MAEAIDAILEYLRQNNFKTAEAALKAELKTRHSQQDLSTESESKDLVLHSTLQIQSSQEKSAELAPNLCILEKPYTNNSIATSAAGKAVDKVQIKDLVGKRDTYSDSTHNLNESVCVEILLSDSNSETLHVKEEKVLDSDVLRNECLGFQPKSVNFEKINQESGAFKDKGAFKDNVSVQIINKNMQEVGLGKGSAKFPQNKEGIEAALPYVQWHSPIVAETKNELLQLSPEGVDSGFRIEKTGLQHGKVYPLDEVGSPQGTKFSCRQHEDVQTAMVQKAFTAMGLDEENSAERLQHGVFQHDENALQIEKVTVVQECFPSERLKYTESAPYRCNLPRERSNFEDIERFQGFSRQGVLIDSGRGNLPFLNTWQDETLDVTFPSSLLPNLKYAHQHLQLPGFCSSDKERHSSQSSTGSVGAQNDLQVGSGSQQGIAIACDNDQNLLEVVNAEEEIQEALPRLPPVRLKSWDKTLEPTKELFGLNLNSLEENSYVNTESALETTFGLGSFLDVPVGQDISSSGGKRLTVNSRPSVSQGIVEDTSELLSNFATAGDGHSESVIDYPDDYWDSDAYEDDDDPGYLRQPIDDEAWFLANELFYPIEDGRSRPSRDYTQAQIMKDFKKGDDDEHSFVDSFFSGEEVYQSREVLKEYDNELEELPKNSSLSPGRVDYDGDLLHPEELKQIKAEPAWQGFVGKDNPYKEDREANMKIFGSQQNDSLSFGDSKSSDPPLANKKLGRHSLELEESDQGKRGEKKVLQDLGDTESSASPSALSRIGTFMYAENPFSYSDVARNRLGGEAGRCFKDEEGCNVNLNYQGGVELNAAREFENMSSDILRCKQEAITGSCQTAITNVDVYSQEDKSVVGINFSGFSFPSPSSAGDIAGSRSEFGKVKCAMDVFSRGDEAEIYGAVGPDDTLASWRRQSNESSPIIGSRDAHHFLGTSGNSTGSGHSTDESHSREESRLEDDDAGCQRDDIDAGADLDDVAAVQEQIQRLQAEEDDFEIFDLRIIHRKNRTGFEEEKDFPVVINSVIAGRYHVTEYLGSAAFSKAIQAHDLHTGMDVCMKIIKNNKDFFDQSLDEIKLLKYINRHDPADKHHILRLYDYFYHREHLFIVCELLRANLYEFHKYNRESGGEVYFTMPRLQCITRQCLEALDFLHGLGLIHCDLKPENILVKSYSRCEVKVIDLGSSCFQTDHLCSYVQSRSYRAPEVILGLSYNQKIDIWSLGCILAELCSGNVLFQNDSLATLLARVVGILGPIDLDMLAKGHDTHKYFTKSHKLYERNPDTDRLEYLLPKKTSLAHRLPMGDQGFVDFVDYLLQVDPQNRPIASEALKHPWLSFPYEPISS